jgi:predicted anti-sigma-YlaC factor YlaD
MHCKQARKLLIRSIDHWLPPEESEMVAAHVSECAECRRFVDAMHLWQPPSAVQERPRTMPDLTERVLANVRPLPPPWVFRQEHQSKQVPHLVAVAVGALGVSLGFLMLCLTLVVALAGDTRPATGHARQLLVPEVWHDLQSWMNSIPRDTAHTIVTLAASGIFLVLIVAWFRTLAVRVGRDRQ